MREIFILALALGFALALGAAAFSQEVTIRWFGQSFFEITASDGTKIIADPYGEIGYPLPSVEGKIVTVTHEHRDHNNVGLVKGNPEVLRGLTEGGKDWNKIDKKIGAIRVYTVPTYHDKKEGAERVKNAIFVYEMDGLRLAHLGDLGHILTPEQLQAIGRVDLLFLPVGGGGFTIDGKEATQVADQINPRIVVPMHYKTAARPDWPGTDEKVFLQGKANVRRLETTSFKISRDKLPREREIIMLQYR